VLIDERSIHALRLAGVQVNNYAAREPGMLSQTAGSNEKNITGIE
jgi:hypothetical protein